MKKESNLNVSPLNNYNRDEVVGSLDVTIKLTYCDIEERTTTTNYASGANIFDGLAWEEEISWTVAQLMKNKFGVTKEDIVDAFKGVIKNLQ